MLPDGRPSVEKPYQKDLSHTTWDKVYERQILRSALLREWMDELQFLAGARVLDVGAGPGYCSVMLAERVGPVGIVYAVDKSVDALAYLARLQEERGIPHIRRIVGDITTIAPGSLCPDAALVTMMLHHTDDPLGILRGVATLLPPGARAIVAEFHPDGPGEIGPPLTERISPEDVRQWCTQVGFEVLTYRRQTPEHYMFVVRRGI
jgi:ubiquinone/menaquinone biosynthesis C-methylase UbiE